MSNSLRFRSMRSMRASFSSSCRSSLYASSSVISFLRSSSWFTLRGFGGLWEECEPAERWLASVSGDDRWLCWGECFELFECELGFLPPLCPCLGETVLEEDLPGFLKAPELVPEEPEVISKSAILSLFFRDEEELLPDMMKSFAFNTDGLIEKGGSGGEVLFCVQGCAWKRNLNDTMESILYIVLGTPGGGCLLSSGVWLALRLRAAQWKARSSSKYTWKGRLQIGIVWRSFALNVDELGLNSEHKRWSKAL